MGGVSGPGAGGLDKTGVGKHVYLGFVDGQSVETFFFN